MPLLFIERNLLSPKALFDLKLLHFHEPLLQELLLFLIIINLLFPRILFISKINLLLINVAKLLVFLLGVSFHLFVIHWIVYHSIIDLVCHVLLHLVVAFLSEHGVEGLDVDAGLLAAEDVGIVFFVKCRGFFQAH